MRIKYFVAAGLVLISLSFAAVASAQSTDLLGGLRSTLERLRFKLVGQVGVVKPSPSTDQLSQIKNILDAVGVQIQSLLSQQQKQAAVAGWCQIPQLKGWPKYTDEPVTRDIAVANVDGDSSNGLEVFAVSSSLSLFSSAHLYAWYANGTPLAGWPKTGEFREPAFVDLDGDGKLEIVAPKLRSVGTDETAEVYAWRMDGTPVPGWPVSTGVQTSIGNVTVPTVADLDGDGKDEIILVVGRLTQPDYVFIWQSNGSLFPNWPKLSCNGVSQAITVGDLDPNFAGLEIVTACGSKVYAWHFDGTPVTGWPVNAPGLSGWMVSGTPALADLDGDGLLEVITTAQHYSLSYGRVYVFHNNGHLMTGWPRTEVYAVNSSPAVADLDGDGQPEVVVGTGTGRLGQVWIWHANGTVMNGWPQTDYGVYLFASPAIADLDGDGLLEIIVIGETSVFAWHRDGTPVACWPIRGESGTGLYQVSGNQTPIVADLNKDGRLEVVAGSWEGHFPFTNKSVKAWTLPLPSSHNSLPWPAFHHDLKRTGLYLGFPLVLQ